MTLGGFRLRNPWCCRQGKGAGCKMLPLAKAQPGCKFQVKCIEGGRRLCARMAAMGIYPGAELEVLCARCGEPCLVKVRGATLSLGAGVSQKIMVAQDR